MNQQQGTIFSKVAMPIAITAIVVYLICSAWVGMRDPYKFTVAYTDSMETSVNATGWVVRSEVPVSGASGVVQLLRGQGEKVAKGKDLAVVYQDETYVASQEELLQVQTDLTALQYATYPESPSGTALEEQMLSSMTSLRQAAEAAGRDPQDITLVAATKVQTSDTIRNAIRAGITICGENRVQELVAHLEDNAYEGAKVHFIGHLQTNKVKFVVGKVDMIESIDSEHLMDAVEKQAAKLDVTQDILLEVNIGDEASKGGAKRSDILALAHHALQCPHLRLRGIMSIPPATATEEENKAFFQETYQLFIDMRNELGDNVSNIDCLSMGMSGDYPLAIAGGSTMVRVGTALFGARPPWHPQG